MSTTTQLPPVARAFAFYAADLARRLSTPRYRVTGITRTFNAKTGAVDLRLQFRDDEDRAECRGLATAHAYDVLIDLGFYVTLAGVDNHIRLGGYYGDSAALRESAPLAKVIPIAAAAARRAS